MTFNIFQVTKTLQRIYPDGGWSVFERKDGLKVEFGLNPEISLEELEKFYNENSDAIYWKENREEAYAEKGWVTPFDVFDDMAQRGFDAVIEDRLYIKEQYPSPIVEEAK